MSHSSPAARWMIRLAHRIAGPGREEWVAAMAAETEAGGGNGWALGCLAAATKDRVARDWKFLFALGLVPALTIASIPVMTIATVALSRTTGLGQLQLMPVLALAPLPFAVLLGAMRPAKPWLLGVLAFVIYQAIPAIGFRILFGTYVYVRWEANLSYYDLYPPFGLAVTFAAWLAGCYWGASWARARKRKFS